MVAGRPSTVKQFLRKALHRKEVDRALGVRFSIHQKQQIEIAKRRLFANILAHPVSREIQNKGFLYGLIGFRASGIDPVSQLIGFLDEYIDVRPVVMKNLRAKVNIRIPSKSDLDNESSLRMPWSSQSWPVAVEKGISGFPKFIYEAQKGRSERGIQVKGKVRGGSYGGQPYLSEMIGTFREDLRIRLDK